MPVPILDLAEQHEALSTQLKQQFAEVVSSGQFILGRFVESFEQSLARWCGTGHAIGVSSGTDALLAAMMAMGIGPGDEVITSPFTFFATAGSIARVGAKPVFVDIDAETFNLDPVQVEASISSATKAVIPVHLFGLPADMEPILTMARTHRLHVIEDAAQAIGAKYRGRPVTSLGDVGCLSFYPTKNLAALGDAGACITNDTELAERIRAIRVHGGDQTNQQLLIGGNFRIDALQASMLSVKLPCVEQWVNQRRAHAEQYHHTLADVPVTTPAEPPGRHHVYNQYTIRIHDGARDRLRTHLNQCGIGNRIYYAVPLHLLPCFAYLGYDRGAFPRAEQAAEEVLSLPIYPEMTPSQSDEVVTCVRNFF